MLAVPSAWGQIGAIVLGGVVGSSLLRGDAAGRSRRAAACRSSRRVGVVGDRRVLRAADRPAARWSPPCRATALRLFEAFYRAGSLVFGGGHVVLPLLQAAVVPPGWVSNDAFLAGYGAAQAVPGPLFTFSAYLGAVMGPPPNGWAGAIAVPRRDVPAVVPAGDRRRCRSGTTLRRRPWRAGGAARRQRRRGRAAAGRALPSGVDVRRSPSAGDFALGDRGLPAAVHVAGAALAGGGPERTRRRCDRENLGRVDLDIQFHSPIGWRSRRAGKAAWLRISLRPC